jgi:hypothetical protein
MLAGPAAWLDATAVAALDPDGTSRARIQYSFQSPRAIQHYSNCLARVAILIRAILAAAHSGSEYAELSKQVEKAWLLKRRPGY